MDQKLSLQQRLADLKDMWFLTEPAYFMVLCTHKIEINSGIGCDIACGGGYIYINDEAFADKSDVYLDDAMKCEIIRILLKHPYGRQLPNRVKMYLASNFVIANNMKFKEMHLKRTDEYFKSFKYDKECLETIYDNIKLPESQDSKDAGGLSSKSAGNDCLNNFDDACSSAEDAIAKTQFWKEDEFQTTEINNIINKIESSNSWGNIPGNIVDTIKNAMIPKFNYKAVFQQFRSTVLSSDYSKTRMKPSRRFGYAAMGSKRKNTTSLLVAIDTSGSISNEDLQLALGFIKGFFKYATDKLDIVQFDTKVYEDSIISITKAPKTFDIHGRGGTDFDPVFEYVQNKSKTHYDGVLIITDGYASVPDKKYLKTNWGHTKYLWVINSENNWKYFKDNDKFSKFGKCTYVTSEK